MDWSNRFTLAGFTVTYCIFQMVWEMIKKTEDDDRMEICHRWYKNRELAEKWYTDRISGK